MRVFGFFAAGCIFCSIHISVYSQTSGPAGEGAIVPISNSRPATQKASSAPASSRRPTTRPAASQPSTAQATAELQEMVDQIAGQVEEIRGWKYTKSIKAEVLTDEQVKSHMEKEIDEEIKSGEYEQLIAFLRLSGLIPPDCDIKTTYKNFVADQAGGFYSSKTGKYYMPQRISDEYSKVYKEIITSHELTHALDDQKFGLEKIAKSREETEDWSLAWRSVAEGSATILMSQYTLALAKAGKLDMAEMLKIAAKEEKETAKLAKLPSYFMSLIMVYTVGPNFLLKGKDIRSTMMSSPDDMNHLGDTLLETAKNPPKSTEQVLHPEKYWDKSKFEEPVDINDTDMDKIFAGLKLKAVYKNTVGEMLCSLLSRKEGGFDRNIMTSPARCTNKAAAGWGGDRFYLLLPAQTPGSVPADNSPANAFTGVWITLWDTPADVGEFQAAYEKFRQLNNQKSFPLGKRGMIYCLGLSDEQVQALKNAFETNPPAFTSSGKRWSPADTAGAITSQSQPAKTTSDSSGASKVGEIIAPTEK